jgi:hypothetical protein
MKKGSHLSEENKKKISQANRGHRHTEETKKRMSERVSGKNNPLFGKHHSAETRRKISEAHKGKHISEEHKRKLNGSWIGKHHSIESRKKISEASKGRHYSIATRKRMRESALDRISNSKCNGGQVQPTYNPKGCDFIYVLAKQLNISFQHSLNGGEFCFDGYFLDGYNKEHNIIIEIDEPRHYYGDGKLKTDDLYRQQYLIDTLKPIRFLRVNIRDRCYYDVITGKVKQLCV